MKSKRSFLNLVKKLGAEYFWVLVFCFAVLASYHQMSQKKMAIYEKLRTDLGKLKSEKKLALKTQKDLHLRIKSQDDPQWLQMVLMRKLGVVPEGQTKVHFIESSGSF